MASGQKVRPLYRNYNLDIIDQWGVVGDAVAWKLDLTKAGRYEVRLSYGCRESDGGKLEIAVGNSSLVHSVIPTAGREVFRTLAVGFLNLNQGKADLLMTAKAVKGQELMALHKIWLRLI